MFRKLYNTHFNNKLLVLSNKLDIINTKLDNKNVYGCCDCKYRESLIYKEFVDYIDTKFSEIISDITSDMEYVKICDILKIHNNDILDNLKHIIQKISVLNIHENFESKLECIQETLSLIKYKCDLEENIKVIIKNIDKLNKDVICQISDIDNTF